MKRLILPAIFLFFCGCRSTGTPSETFHLEVWQSEALNRNLNGETVIALQNLARNTARRNHRMDLPDLARYIRENNNENSAELIRDLLWESVEYCNVQFVRDPDYFIRNCRRSQILCRTALLIAEKQYLDQIIWQTPAQKARDREVTSELSSLCGGLPSGDIPKIRLILPDDELSVLPDTLSLPVSEDPAEALQFAHAVYSLPDEIRRQKMADENFYPDCLLEEVVHLAASYSLYISMPYLQAARQDALQKPTPENIWRYRKWYYRVQMDLSRLPSVRGEAKDRQFLNSMLLLQEGF